MDDHGDDADAEERSTAPQSEYTSREVGLGIAVMVVGVALSIGLPLALTL